MKKITIVKIVAIALAVLCTSYALFPNGKTKADDGFTMNSVELKVKANGASDWSTLKAGDTISNNDAMDLVFNWGVANIYDGSQDETFAYDISSLVGVKIDTVNGVVNNDNGVSTEQVGTWVIESGTLSITLFKDFLSQSDVTGTTHISAKVNVSNEEDKFQVQANVGLGDSTYAVTVNTGKNPSSLSINKTANRSGVTVNADGTVTQEYTITATANDGAVTDITVTDTFGSALSRGSDVTVGGDIAADTVAVGAGDTGFSYGPFSLAKGEKATFTYSTVLSTDGLLAQYVNGNDATVQNSASAEYTKDDTNTGNTSTVTAKTEVTKPSVSKDGSLNTTEDEATWTVTITPGTSTLDKWDFTDTLGTGVSEPTTINWATYKNGSSTEFASGTFSSFSDVDLSKINDTLEAGKLGTMKLTYTTAVTSQTVVSKPSYTNKSTITSTDDPDVKADSSKTITGTVGETKLISKTAGTEDADNDTIEWTSIITIPAGVAITDFKYTDTIGDGHKYVGDSLQVVGATPSATNAVDNATSFTIDFADGDMDNTAGLSDKVITMTYKTVYDGTKNTIKNTGKIEFKDNGVSETQTDEDTATPSVPTNHDMLAKGANWSTGTTLASHQIPWTLTIDCADVVAEGTSYSTLTITDTLPENMSLPTNSIKLMNGTNYGGGTAVTLGSGFAVNTSTAGVATFTISTDWLKENKHTDDKVYLGYYTEPINMETYIDAGNKEYSNSVTGTLDGENAGSSTAKRYWTPEKNISKTGKYDDSTAPYVKYTLDINKSASDLATGDTISAVDTMAGSISFVPPGGMTITKTPAGGTQETITNVSELFVYNPTANTITFTLEDEAYYQIVYQCHVDAELGTNFSASNTIQVTGLSQNAGGGENSITARAISNSSSAENTTGTLAVYKYHDTTALAGAQFKLTRMVYNTATSSYSETDESVITTNGEGMASKGGIQFDHVYKLVETVAPTNYKLDTKPYYFIIQGADKLEMPEQFKTDAGHYFTNATTFEYLQISNEPGVTPKTISLSKREVAKTDELPGADIALYKFNEATSTYDTTAAYSFTSGNTEKTLTLADVADPDHDTIAPGTYKMVETGAPTGYDVETDIVFTVTLDGTISNVTTTSTQGSGLNVGGTGIVMYDAPLNRLDDFYFSKNSIAGSDELIGAHIVITKADSGDEVTSFDSTAVATKIPGNLFQADTNYVLTETVAPAGYKVTSSVTFYIDDTNAIHVTNAAGNYEVDTHDGLNRLILKDEALSLRLNKTDDKGTSLPGAELTIVDKETKALCVILTSEDHAMLVPTTKFVVGRTYVLHEVTAPTGYKVAEDIEFLFNADGTMVRKDLVEAKDNILVMVDEKETVEVTPTPTPTATPTIAPTATPTIAPSATPKATEDTEDTDETEDDTDTGVDNNTDEVVDTGDSAPIQLMVGIFILSFAGIAGAVIFTVKKH